MAGYQQLEAIARHYCGDVTQHAAGDRHSLLARLVAQVDRALQKSRWLAEDLAQAHCWLMRIAGCLRYPPYLPGFWLTGQRVER